MNIRFYLTVEILEHDTTPSLGCASRKLKRPMLATTFSMTPAWYRRGSAPATFVGAGDDGLVLVRPELSLPIGTVSTVRDTFPYVPIHVPTGRDRLSNLRILQMRVGDCVRYGYRTGMTLRSTFEACPTTELRLLFVRVCFIKSILSPYQQHGALTTFAACAAP